MTRSLSRAACALLLLAGASRAAAQTETVVAGVMGDSSIVAPVVVWNRTGTYGDGLFVSLYGWTVTAEKTWKLLPSRRALVSMAVAPLNSHSSNRIYAGGRRQREREFEDGSLEAGVGIVQERGERVASEIRLVALWERVGEVDAATRAFWSSPYAGLRARHAYSRITAQNPLLMTYEGSDLRADAEVFLGEHIWSRAALRQRYSRRFGPLRAGESVSLFYGSSLNTVNAFLVGGSWPVGDLQPLYGHRYAEFRLDRGVIVTGDLQYLLTESIAIGGHATSLLSPDIREGGMAVDVSVAWRGVGMRFGVGRADDQMIAYGSILAARFMK